MTLLIEAPVARAVMARMGRGRAMTILPRLAESVAARASAAIAIGSKIERYEVDGDVHIQCVYALREPSDDLVPGNGCYWDNQGVVIIGADIPESVVVNAVGRPITDIVDHPHLRGLAIGAITNEEGSTVVIDAKDCMWPIARIAAEG